MEIQNLNRLNDALFKAIFGENPEITLDFINSVFKYVGTPLFKSIDFIDRELDPVEEGGKESRLDLVGVELATGAKVNLEIQVVKQKYFGKRSLYYWARLYNDLKRGDKYSDLTRTVTINILDFVLFEEKSEEKNWHSSFGVYDKKTGKQLTEDLEMHFIELPKWKIQKSVKDMKPLERWTSYFDKKTQIEELEEIVMQEPMVKEAVRRESIFTQDEIRRRKYDLIEKAERDRIGQMDYAWEQGKEEGLSQGISQGITQGISQGISQGMEKLNLLIQRLVSEGKSYDILAITSDNKLREEMFAKYNIK